ncbi:hypothetical protein FRY74_06365 [Vicingus serpentipes]|uniref:RHS repeat protein n=1 Tax=Vicingus serpentipes TaxID=1926625 RepID=A0A5C6RVF9_9FLAO|nr:hypothetical protein [Vicingus serpentipes]TXB66193.1 hypothetical protein FRY74_06365 [Vicingus serpentipes]
MLETVNEFDLKGNVKSCSVNTYQYNSNGVLETDVYHKYFVKFDTNNQLIAYIDSDRDIVCDWNYYTNAIGLKEYTSNKDFIRVLHLDAETNDFRFETTHQFNKQGFLVLSSVVNYNGDLTMYTRYYYDDFNRLIRVVETRVEDYEIDKIYKEELYEYNLDDDLISKKTMYINHPEYTTTEMYTLDNNKNVVSTIKKDVYKVVLSELKFDYIFDQYGNWIKQSVYRNNKKVSFTKRNIQYH